MSPNHIFECVNALFCIRFVELGVSPMQLFHFWSRDVHPVQNLVLSWRVSGRPPHGVSRQWINGRWWCITACDMRQALACQVDFWRQLGSPAPQQQQGAGSSHQPFWLQMNCEAHVKMPLLSLPYCPKFKPMVRPGSVIRSHTKPI